MIKRQENQSQREKIDKNSRAQREKIDKNTRVQREKRTD